MPTADGRIKGISLSGVSNPWLNAVTYVNEAMREMTRLTGDFEEVPCPGSAPETSRPRRATAQT